MNVDKIRNWSNEVVTNTFQPKEINDWSYFRVYQKKVIKLTKKVIDQVKDHHLLVKGSLYSIDHIIPISYGWKQRIDAELLADIENLQVLPLIKNIIKANRIDLNDPRVKYLLVKWRINTNKTE